MYLIPSGFIPHGNISVLQFLTIFEQYLFFSLAPTINKTLVAQTGSHRTEEQKLAHRTALGTPYHAYIRFDGVLTLVQSFPSRGSVGALFGYNAGYLDK